MELPFTPTFFKKLDIYQQLISYEKTETKNSTWNLEKVVLKWAVSPENKTKGSRITKNRIKDIVEKSLKKQIHLEESQEILNALAMREFLNNVDYGESGVFNNRSYLAGRIILETKDFRAKLYDFWIMLWWAIFGVGVILLILEVIIRFRDFFMSKRSLFYKPNDMSSLKLCKIGQSPRTSSTA